MHHPKESDTNTLWPRQVKSENSATEFIKRQAINQPGLMRLTARIAALVPATAALCTIVILSGTPVSASQPWVRAFAEVPDLHNPGHVFAFDTLQLFNQPLATAQESVTGPDQDVLAIARAQPGDLGVSVLAISGGLTSGEVAEGQAQFFDNLRITSGTLPLGAPITLKFSLDLDGTTSFTGGGYNGGPDSVIHLSATVNGVSYSLQELFKNGQTPQVTGTRSFTVDSTVGATVTYVGLLDINARSGFLPSQNSAFSDYLHSARFFADPTSPEISLVSDSGHDYSAPLPDQGSTAFLVGLGFVATAFGSERIRKTRSESR